MKLREKRIISFLKLFIFLAAIFPMLLVAATVEELQPSTPRFSAEQILNGELPGRKVSPAVEAKHNREGFAVERLYSVPAPGVHPRVLFGPEDLPRIREQFKASADAAEILRQLRERVEKDLSGPDGWGQEVFDALAVGNIEVFRAVWDDSRNPKRHGPPGTVTHPFLSALMDMAFIALIDGDREDGEKAAAAIATYAEFLQPRVEEAETKPGNEHYWLALRTVMGDSATVGFMYDFAQPFMTPQQAKTTQKLIASIIKGRYGFGMDLPPHWRNWNHIGMGLYYPLLALSIEGEPGYDPRIYQRGCEVAQHYILYSNSANGVGTEGMGYHTAGMSHTAIMMLAMANRGDNIFTLERWRRVFDTWCIYAMQPYGREWQSSGDLGTFPPDLQVVDTARFLFPSDKRIAFVEQNLPDDRRLQKALNVRLLQLLCPSDLDGNIEGLHASQFELPETMFDEERGMLYARTGWGTNDLSLQVTCRSDTAYASHDHPDRGSFYFSSHGQPWAVSSMRMTEPKYLNQITIDGRGQGYFTPPGKWVEMTDTPGATVAVMDTKYCYDWQWQKTVYMSTDEQLANEPWLEWVRPARDRLLSRFPREQWERDPLPIVKEYYDGYLAGNPRMWDSEDSWVVRAPHYPVEKSFRTICMSKGRYPYLLVCDDIKKDNAEHLYQWRMRIPNAVEPYKMGSHEALLGRITDKRDTSYNVYLTHNKIGQPLPEKGQPMLLVRVLQANQPNIPKYQDNLTVETLNFVKHDDTHQYFGREMGLGKRLVIPSRSVEPEYKILLFPHRHGDALPTTEFSKDGETLTIEWNNQKDVYRMSKDNEGRTHLQRKRKQ